MSDYVSFGAGISFPGPIECDDTTLYAFFVRTSKELLEDLSRRMFGAPSGEVVRCEPLLGDVLVLTFGTIENVGLSSPGPSDMGRMHERHCCVWVPVRCTGPKGTPKHAAYQPYIWIDNPISFASGREDWGYAKSWGWAEFDGCNPGDDTAKADPERLTLDVFSYAKGGGRVERMPLLALERRGFLEGLAEPPELGQVTPGQLLATGVETLGGEDEAPGTLGHGEDLSELFAEGVDQMFLRQFRSMDSPLEAQTSQIVTAGAKVKGRFTAGWLGWYDLTVHELIGQPVTSELGLGSRSRVAGFRARFDFGVERGRVLWSG